MTLRQLLELAEIEPDALLDAPLDGNSEEFGGMALGPAQMMPGSVTITAVIPTYDVSDFEGRVLRQAEAEG